MALNFFKGDELRFTLAADGFLSIIKELEECATESGKWVIPLDKMYLFEKLDDYENIKNEIEEDIAEAKRNSLSYVVYYIWY